MMDFKKKLKTLLAHLLEEGERRFDQWYNHFWKETDFQKDGVLYCIPQENGDWTVQGVKNPARMRLSEIKFVDFLQAYKDGGYTTFRFMDHGNERIMVLVKEVKQVSVPNEEDAAGGAVFDA